MAVHPRCSTEWSLKVNGANSTETLQPEEPAQMSHPDPTDHNLCTSTGTSVTFSGCASSAKAKHKQVRHTHIWRPCWEGKVPHWGSFAILALSHGAWADWESHSNKTHQMPCLCSDWMGKKLRIKLLNVCNPSSFTFFF